MSKKNIVIPLAVATAAALAMKRAREEAEYRKAVQERLDRYVGKPQR